MREAPWGRQEPPSRRDWVKGGVKPPHSKAPLAQAQDKMFAHGVRKSAEQLTTIQGSCV